MIKKFLKTICFLSIVSAGILVACGARAATLGVVVSNATPEIGQPFRIDIPLDTQGDDANAIQAQVFFPADQFTLQNIIDGASPVSFWIAPPTEVASGVIAFSGIMPDGFQGAATSVVSIWLLPTASGAGAVSFGDVELLRNDGNATPISTATDTVTVNVSATVASTSPSRPVSFVTPEPFVPVVSRDPNIYGGQYFLAFSTTDKGSGIAYYQVLEVPGSGSDAVGSQGWQTATSPYPLQDQTLESTIYVRAVDHAGNFIVVKVPPAHPTGEARGHAENDILIIVLCVLLIMIILAARTTLSAKRKKVL